mgnify:CR=1 FL=1
MADAVIRENDNRNLDDRTFSSTAVLTALPNAAHVTLQQLLQSVIDLVSDARLAWSEFERDRPDGYRRIAAVWRSKRGLRTVDRRPESFRKMALWYNTEAKLCPNHLTKQPSCWRSP